MATASAGDRAGGGPDADAATRHAHRDAAVGVDVDVEPISTRGLKGRTARVSLRHPLRSGVVDGTTALGLGLGLDGEGVPPARVLDHRLPGVVRGVSSAASVARFAGPSRSGGGAATDHAGQAARVVELLREVRPSSESAVAGAHARARARAQQLAAELGSPGLADLLARSQAEVAPGEPV